MITDMRVPLWSASVAIRPHVALPVKTRPQSPGLAIVHPFAPVTKDELAAFYRRYNACCNAHAFEDIREFVTDDVVINGGDRGLEAYTEALRFVIRGFPDYHWELRHLVIDPPWIAAHLTDTGTHRGRFVGIEPTGRSVSTEEFAVYRVDGGRIAEVWGMDFHVQLLEQLR
jgi:predicted ester cyclase